MRKLFVLLIVVSLAALGYFILKKQKIDYVKPTTGENIIIFGDSLAYGQGSSNGHDIASILHEKTPYRVINAGSNGDTAINAADRLEHDVLNQNPKVVVILLGGNDFFQKIPVEQTMQSLNRIIDEILDIGSGVILINENKIFATTSKFKELAENKRIPYIEDILDGISGNPELMSDEIHPNDAGYALMAEKIKTVLLDYLK